VDPAGGGSMGPRGKPEAGVLWRGQQVIAAGYGRVGVDIGIGSLSVYLHTDGYCAICVLEHEKGCIV